MVVFSPNDPIPLELATQPPSSSHYFPIPISAEQLIQRIQQQHQPRLLIIDLRNLNSYLSHRLKNSINLNFPSLLIKRFRKGNSPTNFQLTHFITTEAGKCYYSKLQKTCQTSVLTQLDLCLIDDQLIHHTHQHHPTINHSPNRIFLDLLSNHLLLQPTSTLFYLNEAFENLTHNPAARPILLHDPSHPHPSTSNTTSNTIINPLNLNNIHPPLIQSQQPGLLPLQPILPTTPLPAIDQSSLPSSSSKTKPPKLRRIDTSESILTIPPRPTTSPNPPSQSSLVQLPINHLNLSPNHLSNSPNISPPPQPLPFSHHHHHHHHPKFFLQPNPSIHPSPPPNPTLAHPNRSPCSPNTDPEIHFKVSTIIPSFLYLGPEPSKEADFIQLNQLGIRRLLNTALECIDEQKLIQERHPFITKYFQIPLRDFVEETGVQNGIDQANRILDDAFLHSAPTYVHCKAGKSRSVTIVLAYLIHRYRWSLKKSYAHVSERRQGICPNIGFLAELMNFEQRELGSQSHSILRPPSRTGMGSSGHAKNARSVSHHYGLGPGFSVPNTSTTMIGNQVVSPNQIDIEAHPAPGGLTGYSFDSRRPPSSRYHPSKANSLDLIRHHGLRVRSLALGAKNDFFPSSSSTSDDLNNNNHPPFLAPSPEPIPDSFPKGPRDSLPAGFFPSPQPQPEPPVLPSNPIDS